MKNLKKYLLIIPLISLAMAGIAWADTPADTVVTATSHSVLNSMQSQTDAVGANSGFDNGGAPSSVAEIIANVISTALSLLGIIFLGLIIFSGYGWMMAGGDEKVIETAKARMKNAVIGLIIVLAAYSITAFVFNNLNKTMGGGSGDIQGSGGGSGTTCNPACTGKTTCEQGDGGMACKP